MTAHLKSRLVVATAAAAALAAALALITFGPPAQAAGIVEVKYVEPERFADIGRASFDRERNLRTLSEHFAKLGRQLPNGQTLKVEVLDVDLAGEQNFARLHDARVLRGRADWPVMTVKWSLQGAGASKSGEERLSDMHYLMTSARLDRLGGDLPYERRMLDRWFAEKVLLKAP